MTEKKLGIVLTARDAGVTKAFDRVKRAVLGLDKTAASSFRNMKRNMADVGTQANAMGSKIRESFSAIKSAILLVGGAAVLSKPIKEAKDFELQLANVNTLLDGTGVSIERYRGQLLNLAKSSPKTLGDLTTALYQTISAGIPAVEGAAGAFEVLEVAQKAAVAGLSSTEQSVDAIATVLNSYGRENVTAAEAGDKLLKVVQQGRVTFPQLSQYLGGVATQAAKAGVSIDELSSLFITITRSGVKVPQAATGIRALIKAIQKPSKETQEIVDNLNKSLGEGEKILLGAKAMRDIGFTGILKRLTKATGGSNEALTQLFPNVRALTPALVNIGNGFQDFTKFTEMSADATGTLDVAYQKVDATFSSTFDKFKSTVNATLVDAGTNVLPMLTEKFKQLTKFLDQNGKVISGVFKSLVTNLISVGEFFAEWGPTIAKFAKVIFITKIVSGFASSIAALIPILVSFGRAAVAAYSTAAAAATNFVTTARAAGAAQAGQQLGASMAGGVATGFKANAGALSKAVGGLAKNAGLIGAAIAIGTMIAKWIGEKIGKALVKIKYGKTLEQMDAEIAKQNEMLDLQKEAYAVSEGFKDFEEERDLEIAASEGRKLEVRPQSSRDGDFSGADVMIKAAQDEASVKVAESIGLDVLKGKLELDDVKVGKGLDFTAITAAEKKFGSTKTYLDGLGFTVEKVAGSMRAGASRVLDSQGKVVDDFGLSLLMTERKSKVLQEGLMDLDISPKVIKNVQALAQETKSIEELKKRIGSNESQIFSKQEQAAAIRMVDAVEAQAQVSQKYRQDVKGAVEFEQGLIEDTFKNRRSEIVSLQEFTLDQVRKRMAAGATEEEARAAAKMAATVLLDNNIADAQQERLENELALEQARKAAQANVAEYWRLRKLGDDESLAAAEKIRKKQDQLNVTVESYVRTLATTVKMRQQNLNTMKKELSTDKQINLERQKRVEKQLEEQRKAKASQKAAQQRAKYARIKSQYDALTARLQKQGLKTSKAHLNLQLQVLQLDLNKLKLDKDAAASQEDQAKADKDIIALLKQQLAVQELIAAKKREIAAQDRAIADDNARRQEKAARRALGKTGLDKGGVKRQEASKQADAQVANNAKKQSAANRMIEQELRSAKQATAREEADLLKGAATRQKSFDDSAAESAKKKQEEMIANARKLIETTANGAQDLERITEATGMSSDELLSRFGDKLLKMQDQAGILGASQKDQVEGFLKKAAGASEIIKMFDIDVADSIPGNILNAGKKFGMFFTREMLKAPGEMASNFAQGVLALDFGNAAKGLLDPVLNNIRGAADYIDAAGKAGGDIVEGALQQGFGFGGEILGKGLSKTLQAFTGSLSLVFKAGAAVFSKVMGPVFGALQKPIDEIFGGFSKAIDSIFDTGEKDRELDQKKKDVIEANEAQIRVLQQQGASNEEIAKAQAKLASTLDDIDEEATEDPIDAAIQRALQFVENLIARLPGILEQFLVGLAEALPGLITGLMTALTDAIVVVSQNLGSILTSIVDGLVAGLPDLIDGLIEAIPLIIDGIVNAAAALIEKLPEIFEQLIAFVVEGGPKILVSIIKAIPVILGAILEALPGVVESLINAIPAFIEAIVEALPLLVEGLVESLPAFVDALIRAVPKIIVALIKAVPRIIVAVVSLIPQIFMAIFSYIPKIMQAVGTGFVRAVEKAFSWVGDVFDNIIKFFSQVGDGAKSVGNSIWEGTKTVFGKGWLWHKGGMVGGQHRDSQSARMLQAIGAPQFAQGGMVMKTPGDFVRQKMLGMPMIKDDVPAILQSGESVLNRTATGNLGGAAIAALNSGAGMGGGPVNVSVGLTPNEGALNSVVAGLLPLLLGAVNVNVNGQSTKSEGLQGLGYRAVKGTY